MASSCRSTTISSSFHSLNRTGSQRAEAAAEAPGSRTRRTRSLSRSQVTTHSTQEPCDSTRPRQIDRGLNFCTLQIFVTETAFEASFASLVAVSPSSSIARGSIRDVVQTYPLAAGDRACDHRRRMFLRPHHRDKDGKRHTYWSLVETVRTADGPRQRTLCHLGELNDSGAGAVAEDDRRLQ